MKQVDQGKTADVAPTSRRRSATNVGRENACQGPPLEILPRDTGAAVLD